MPTLLGVAILPKEIEREDYYAPIPFAIADAIMAAKILQWPGRPNSPMAARRQLSTGSVLYTLFGRDKKDDAGAIYLRVAADGIGTVFSLFPKPDPGVTVIHETRWNWFRAVAHGVWVNWEVYRDKVEPQLPLLASIIEEPISIITVRPDGTAEMEIPPPPSAAPATPEPARNASADTWLDWRDAENAAGRKVTILVLARKSQWSESTLKKRSAERSRDINKAKKIHK